MNNTGRCAACRYLRRMCRSDCIFSPYFPFNNPERFACVHRIYGASNVGKMLQKAPIHLQAEAADNFYFEAKCRIQDPVYGCVGIISQLYQQIRNTESKVAKIRAEIALLIVHSDAQQLAQPHHDYHHNNIEMEAYYLNTFFSERTNIDEQSQPQASWLT